MSAYFIDTSALLKRYVFEIGSDRVEQIVEPSTNNRLYIAQVTPIEIISAVARRVREKSVSSDTLPDVRAGLARHLRRGYVTIVFSDEIASIAMNLLANHPLRAFDSIQLATALAVEEHLKSAGQASLVFLCSDQRLLSAASAVGLAVEEPK
jgi:uncharacterized protein